MRVLTILRRFVIGQCINDSGRVTCSQTGVHPNLVKHVRRHLQSPWLQAFHQPTLESYRLLKNDGVFSEGRPIILDSGCGTGKSTQQLALRYPGSIVIGVDQSQARLKKSGVNKSFLRVGNCILLRAELSTFWRLLAGDGLSPERHFLLYPNPWPKPGHLSRRWHGHPVFPQLLALGGEIELRCNWEIYAQEFAFAVRLASGTNVSVKQIKPKSGMTPFEHKYLERGQLLFAVVVPENLTEAFRLPG
jgi:tRNA (guanine-N7-)-methyltransferase